MQQASFKENIKFWSFFCSIIVLFNLPLHADTLIYADFGVPVSLDPITCSKPSEFRLSQLIFDSLITQNSRGEFILSLAKELDISSDGLSYTFILRDNLQWADGKPITARDIEFTLDLMLNPQTHNYNPILDKYIENVVCIHPQMLTITLAQSFFSPLSLFTFKILPKHKFTTPYLKIGDPFTRMPLGCGPFQIVQIEESQITLEPNPYFSYRRKPGLSKVIAKFYSSKKEAVQDLLQKKIHLVTETLPEDWTILEKNPALMLQKYQTRTIHWIAIQHNPGHRYAELFQDYRFRRSLLQSLNTEKILREVFDPLPSKGRKVAAHSLISGPFPNGSWAYDSSINPLPYNLPYAKQLLKEVLIRKGYSQNPQGIWGKEPAGPIQLSLKYSMDDPNIAKAAIQIAAYIQNLGINIRLEPKEESVLLYEIRIQHDFDLVYTNYTFDDTYDIFPLFDPAATEKGGTNFHGFVDSRLMELFLQLHSSLNPWLVRASSHKIHRFLHEETAHLFLWQLDSYAAYLRNLRNVESHPYHLFQFPENWKIVAN